MNLVPGAILISRNNNEALNTSLGFWNHVSCYIGDGWIVEAQEGYGVIETRIEHYEQRDYTWFQLTPRNLEMGERAAQRAKCLVGLPYRPLSSIRRRTRNEERGVNCVDAGFRLPYEYATNRRFKQIHTPDQVAELAGSLFRK